jgi:hypothetical protein
MDSENANPLESRTPTPRDLVHICRSLNSHGARYVIVGGFAVLQQGFSRTTEDIDVLLEDSIENQARVLTALECLPDKAVRDVRPTDLNEFLVVRVADEVVVDLMLKTCGIDFRSAEKEIEWHDYDGVRIPFASAGLLFKMKQTYRDKDVMDRHFLANKLKSKEQT